MLPSLLSATPRPALVLGLCGLLPFWATALGAWTAELPVALWLLDLQIYYGAVVLSFLGAVHWGSALARPRAESEGEAGWNRLGWSVMPALIGWLALIAPQVIGVATLLLGFAFAHFADQRAVKHRVFSAWYLPLRQALSLGVVLAMAVTLARFFGL